MKDSVEIIRDTWGIPHIFSSNETDLCFAIGYVHAQDRLWQMELLRRTACGTLSEIFGKLSLDTDRLLRTLGFKRFGKFEFERLPDASKKALQSYCAGINAILEDPKYPLPLEFKLIGHKPKPWDPLDTMAFGRLMQFQLNGQSSYKLALAKLQKSIGWDKIKELFPQYPLENPSILPNGIEEYLKAIDGSYRKFLGPFLPNGGGSNSWAVSGEKTDSGKPILCSDPHLAPSLPSIWYLSHLISDERNIIGVGPPVVPAILIGHNQFCGWGFTVANVDAEDLFLEKIHPENPKKYEFKNEWKDISEIKETIYVKGEKNPIEEFVRYTHHGPLIDLLVGYLPERNYRLAMASYCFREGETIQAILDLNKAKNWNDFCEAIKKFAAPNQNVSYADIYGNIGHYTAGKIPIRAKMPEYYPLPGWTGEYEWIGEIPFEKKPHCFNPTKKTVVLANHRTVEQEKFEFYIGKAFDPGYRASIIENTLNSKEKITMEDCKELQLNMFSLPGKIFIEKIKEIHDQDPEISTLLTILRNWDYNLKPDSVGAAVYETLRSELLDIVFKQGLFSELIPSAKGVGFHPLLKKTTEGFHNDIQTLFGLMENPNSWWVNQLGGREQWIKTGLKNSYSKLRSQYGNNPSLWTWGKIHQIRFPHAMSMKKPLDKVFNVGPKPVGGDQHTVCQIAFVPDNPEDFAWCPSYRQIVDFSDFDNSLTIYAPGQSGNLASPHYSDLFDLWLKGDYIPMLWSKAKIRENQKTILQFIPEKI